MIWNKEEFAAILDISELQPEMCGLLVDLREHVRNDDDSPVCGAAEFEVDLLVTAALASDCDDCRLSRGVALVCEKQWDGSVVGQRPEPVYMPEPMENADRIIESARENRDGIYSTVEIVCPFCGGAALIDAVVCETMHELPACAEYEGAEDALAYIKLVNERHKSNRAEK